MYGAPPGRREIPTEGPRTLATTLSMGVPDRVAGGALWRGFPAGAETSLRTSGASPFPRPPSSQARATSTTPRPATGSDIRLGRERVPGNGCPQRRQ
jgi:hypothetical protein